jgi:hypothetical protein
MRRKIVAATAISTLIVMSAGCGEKTDYRERLLKLQEQSKKELAKMEATYKAEIVSYKQKLALNEKELRSKVDELAEARRRLAGGRARPAMAARPSLATAEKEAKGAAVKPAAPSEVPEVKAPAGSPDLPKEISLIEQFMLDYGDSIEEGRREQYQKDFAALLAQLRAQAQVEPAARRKERFLAGLREKIEAATDEEEKQSLENRMEKIKNASGEDLEGALDYYQRLDNNNYLNWLMDEYGISRDEMSSYGITPPPRTSWGPDIKEITYNLNSFVADYAPLIAEEQRAQYQKDFNDLLGDLSTRPTDAQVIQRKNQMLADLQARYAAAPENEKQRIERRIQRLEGSDIDSLRPRIQMDKARAIYELSEKYGIPRSELRESGVMVRGWRRGR